jgi:tetratricopeptide (TPR) repeat protein
VVSGQRLGEELDIYTPDGQRHQLEQGSIKRLGKVDLAVLTFSSTNSYELALTGDAKSVSSGSNVYVSGFPLPTDAVPMRIFRYLKGYVIANSTLPMPNGYQLLYENKTLPGMSGGAVLDDQGQLIGIHGAGETDIAMSEQKGLAVKTGHNQAVPTTYYEKYYSDTSEDTAASKTSRQQTTIEISKSAEKYFDSGNIKFVTGDQRGAIADFGQAIVINPQYADAYKNRGRSKLELGDEEGAIADFNRAIVINPLLGDAFFHRSLAKWTRDRYGACQDMRQSELLGSSFAKNYIPEACR